MFLTKSILTHKLKHRDGDTAECNIFLLFVTFLPSKSVFQYNFCEGRSISATKSLLLPVEKKKHVAKVYINNEYEVDKIFP